MDSALLAFGLSSLTTIFFVVDPPGVVPLFLTMTKSDSADHRNRTARRACITAAVALATFAAAGGVLFEHLGISLGAFKVAGGILLFLLAVDLLRAEPTRQRTTPEETREGAEMQDVSVFPLGIPMLAGPGAIATVMVLIARAETKAQKGLVFASIAFTLGVAWVLLLSANRIERALGKTGLNVLHRVMGLILAATAMQFVIDGIRDTIPILGTLPPAGP